MTTPARGRNWWVSDMWEYCYIRTDLNQTIEGALEEMNRLGSVGWEAWHWSGACIWFKRRGR